MHDDDDEIDYGLGPGLPPPHVLGFQQAATLPTMSSLLLNEARMLAGGKDYNGHRLAMILAHAACDVQTEATMAQLFIARDVRYLHGPLKDLMGNQVSLHLERVRKVYSALSDDDPKTQTWWGTWRDSIAERNKVAHGGTLTTEAQVSITLDACRAYVEHLQAVSDRHRPTF